VFVPSVAYSHRGDHLNRISDHLCAHARSHLSRPPADRQLRGLYYVGIKTARAILAIVRRFERNAEATPEGGGGPIADPSPL